jgi:hypothetical protein
MVQLMEQPMEQPMEQLMAQPSKDQEKRAVSKSLKHIFNRN